MIGRWYHRYDGLVLLGVVLTACGSGGGGGEAGQDPGDAAIHDDGVVTRDDVGLDSHRDAPPLVTRDARLDTAEPGDTWRDVPRDIPRDIQDLPADARDVIRELPYQHRDTGGDFPTRDTNKG